MADIKFSAGSAMSALDGTEKLVGLQGGVFLLATPAQINTYVRSLMGTGVSTFLNTPSSANLAAALTDETGTGALVFANSPTLVTPALGTPASGVATNLTGTAAGLTAGIVLGLKSATTTVDVSAATAPTTGQGLIAVDSTHATWQTLSGGGNALTSNPLSQFAATTSAQFAGVISDETGTGLVVLNNAPTFIGPILGTPASGNLSNCTAFPAASLSGALPFVENAQTGTTYTVLSGDQGKAVTLSNASAIAVTLPQATGSFAVGYSVTIQNLGAGTATITPTTSTINGVATLVLTTGAWATIISDGTNYQALIGSSTNQRTVGLPFNIGDGANALSTNAQSFPLVVPFACTITGWSIAASPGTCTVKFCKKASGAAVPTISDSINTSGVALASGTLAESTTVSDFTSVAVAAGDVIIAIATTVASSPLYICPELKVVKTV